VALAVNLAVAAALGFDRPMESDSLYFLEVAANMAAGKGYVVSKGFWPDAPSMRRLPGWPATVCAGLRMLPQLPPDVVMRLLAICINAAAAGVVCMLTGLLLRRRVVALIAGLAYALHPTALYCAWSGLSEPLFVLVAALGAVFLVLGIQRPAALPAGFLLLGCSCLVRANFVVWIVFACLLWAVALRGRRVEWVRRRWLLSGLCVVLFLAPPFVWAVRNRTVCGRFPVLSTIRGQTFYGGNNVVVANDRSLWGYWVFPDAVPGETPMRELARRFSEFEVDDYYFKKGTVYMRNHWRTMPRLLLGKLVRAYVPVPWQPTWRSCALCAFRWLIYAGAVLGIARKWTKVQTVYKAFLAAVLLANLTTVLVFYGYARFAFAMEPFLLPFVGVGSVILLERAWQGAKAKSFRAK